ncbi:MAG TPA: cold shock domain-containing protein [Candidatus Korarchaeota archaeon]|nr:cold shock domain-containing protein [Candidatus Korarchaeota archaeon]
MRGIVKRWLIDRGYGFIESEGGGEDIFVHHSDIKEADELVEGQKVEFEVQTTNRGPRAINVKLIE